GWRVREVVAHMTMLYRSSLPRFLVGMLRARFDFNRFADRYARATTERLGDDDLLQLLRDNITNPWTPPGGGKAGALSHDVIHGLDITEPLGLPGPPAERVAMMLASAGPRNLEYFGVDLNGVRLTATDADVSIGDGRTQSLPAREILLVVTGRRALADDTEESA
ncbi:MAG: maleylpyruvate isomerase family mycothiol-dependent enzyme, partial [Stackebrandtia sp.]